VAPSEIARASGRPRCKPAPQAQTALDRLPSTFDAWKAADDLQWILYLRPGRPVAANARVASHAVRGARRLYPTLGKRARVMKNGIILLTALFADSRYRGTACTLDSP